MSNALRAHLLAIKDAHGQLTPAVVVNEARDPGHPLHSRFEWDDAIAGEAWRREQARHLIRECEIVYREGKGNQGPRSVRAFHSVPSEEGRAYQSAEEVASDPFLRELVLRDMERDYKQLKARYGHFREFVDMLRADLEGVA